MSKLKPDFRHTSLCVINAPHFYRDPAFVEWLNDPSRGQASWHKKGQAPNEYSDLFFTYDEGDGSDSDMPEHIWEEICELMEEHHVRDCLVWLQNLQECEDHGPKEESGTSQDDPEPSGTQEGCPEDQSQRSVQNDQEEGPGSQEASSNKEEHGDREYFPS